MLLVCTLALSLGAQLGHPRIVPSNVEQVEVVGQIARDVWEIDLSRDGRRIAMLGWEQPVEIYETKKLIHFETLAADKKPIHFAFSPVNGVFAYCENSSHVEILHADTGAVRIIETGQSQPEMSFSADGKLLGTGGYGTTASLWDVQTGELIRSLDVGPEAGGLSVVFSPDNKTVAVGHRNANACLFDAATGERLHVFDKPMTHGLEFDPTGERLAIAYVDGNVGLYEVKTGEQLHLAATGAEGMYRVTWSPDGSLLVSTGKKGDIVVWNPADLSIIRRLPAPEWVICAKFTRDGSQLLTAGGAATRGVGKREVQIWAVPLKAR